MRDVAPADLADGGAEGDGPGVLGVDAAGGGVEGDEAAVDRCGEHALQEGGQVGQWQHAIGQAIQQHRPALLEEGAPLVVGELRLDRGTAVPGGAGLAGVHQGVVAEAGVVVIPPAVPARVDLGVEGGGQAAGRDRQLSGEHPVDVIW